MKTKSKILDILRQYLPYMMKEFQVQSMGIFGSYSREESNKDSDIDILVEFSVTPGIVKFMNLREFLMSILGEKIDLATKNALKPDLKANILQETIYA